MKDAGGELGTILENNRQTGDNQKIASPSEILGVENIIQGRQGLYLLTQNRKYSRTEQLHFSLSILWKHSLIHEEMHPRMFIAAVTVITKLKCP